MKKFFVLILVLLVSASLLEVEAKKDDLRSRELKYQYEVLKDDAKKDKESKIYNLTPSGYMTVDQYEALSEYKDKSNLQIDIPQFQTPSSFKYVPKPLYRIVRYNDPPGSPEISLGKRLYLKRQVNAQGIISPDFSMLVYPAVYYYTNSASVACDLFVIPLEDGDTNLNKVLRANTAKKLPDPIMTTDKTIDNYAAFRTLTPVDFTPDGSKLLVKQKIGSREDGIWQTSIYVYDFKTKVDYDLFEIRDAIVYFWEEYMAMNLDEKRWDIYPIGFDKKDPNKIIVQAFAFTGEKPVFLGTWSVDWQGNQSRLISFDKNYKPEVSVNGFKVIQDGIEDYDVVEKEKELQVKQSKEMKKQYKKNKKQAIKLIEEEYEYTVKGLKQDYKDEYRDYKKLRSLSGNVESPELQSAYKQYLIDQANKDIEKTQKQIDKKRKEIDKIDAKIDKLYEQTGDTSEQVEPEDAKVETTES
ncbi:hypothetical protein IJ472_04495 [bacterium]|nr:hypothetical protein [bacterium]